MVLFDGHRFQAHHNAGLIDVVQVDACMVAGHTVVYLKSMDQNIGIIASMEGAHPQMLFSDSHYFCNQRFIDMKQGKFESAA